MSLFWIPDEQELHCSIDSTAPYHESGAERDLREKKNAWVYRWHQASRDWHFQTFPETNPAAWKHLQVQSWKVLRLSRTLFEERADV